MKGWRQEKFPSNNDREEDCVGNWREHPQFERIQSCYTQQEPSPDWIFPQVCHRRFLAPGMKLGAPPTARSCFCVLGGPKSCEARSRHDPTARTTTNVVILSKAKDPLLPLPLPLPLLLPLFLPLLLPLLLLFCLSFPEGICCCPCMCSWLPFYHSRQESAAYPWMPCPSQLERAARIHVSYQKSGYSNPTKPLGYRRLRWQGQPRPHRSNFSLVMPRYRQLNAIWVAGRTGKSR